MGATVQDRARAYVARMPVSVAGSGGHAAAFEVACVLVKGFSLRMDEAAALLAEWNQNCQPPWSVRDLEHKLRQAAKATRPEGYLLKDEGGSRKDEGRVPWAGMGGAAARKLEYDEEALRRVAGDLRADLIWLANRSEVDPATVGSDGFLRLVFRPTEKAIVFADDRSQGAVWPDEGLPVAGPRGMWFLIQPVDGRMHANPRTGKESRRSEEAVTSWRYALLESDEAPAGLWLSAMARMPLPWGVAAIYTSGGRSVHVLLKVDAGSVEEWRAMMGELKAALPLWGVDEKALTPVRLSRLPGVARAEKGGVQKLLYVAPFPLRERLADLPVRRDVEAYWMAEAETAWLAGDVVRMRRAVDGLEFYGRVRPAMASAADDLRAGIEEMESTKEGQHVG